MDYKYTSDEDLRGEIIRLVDNNDALCSNFFGVNLSTLNWNLRSKTRRQLLEILEGTMTHPPFSVAALNHKEKARFEVLKEAARIAALPKTEECGRKLKALMSEIDEAEGVIQSKQLAISEIQIAIRDVQMIMFSTSHRCEQLDPGTCYLCGQPINRCF